MKTDWPADMPLFRRAQLDDTDTDNASRLLAVHGRDVIFVVGRGWGVWDGTRFNFEDGDMRMIEIGHRLRSLYIEEAELFRSPDVTEKERAEFIRRNSRKRPPVQFENQEAMDNAIRRARAKPKLEAAHDVANLPPIKRAIESAEHRARVRALDLDADPWALIVLNGQIDLREVVRLRVSALMAGKGRRHAWSKVLREADRSALPTRCAPVRFDPVAECPAWQAFMERVLPDAAVRECFQRALGMTLHGSNSKNYAILLRGSGGNGKSVIFDVLQAVLGTEGGYAGVCKIQMFLEPKFEDSASKASPEEVDLPGVRLYMASEPEGTDALSAKKIKQFAGGDKRPVRQLNKPQFYFRPSGFPFISFNRTPKIRTEDEGLRRRLVFFPFDVNLRALPPDLQRDYDEVVAELTAEISGILNWMLEGFREFNRIGLAPPEKMTALKDTLLEASDPVGSFLKECTVEGPPKGINVTEFYAVYSKWCDRTSSTEYRQPTVRHLMIEKGFEVGKSRGTHRWRKLAWVPGEEMDALLLIAGFGRTPMPQAEDPPF